MKQPVLAGKDASIARIKPEIPKGKKPALKNKPAIEGSQTKRLVNYLKLLSIR